MDHRTRIRRLLAVASSVTVVGAITLAAPSAVQASIIMAHHTSLAAGTHRDTIVAVKDDARRACPTAVPSDQATCFALYRTNIKPREGRFAVGQEPSGYGPGDLQSAYDLPSSKAGGGQTVAVIEAYDDPTDEADLNVYRGQYGLPPCTTANGCFEKVNQKGQQYNYPAANSGWAVEQSLDIDMVSAACPNCHILVVEADNQDLPNLGKAVNEAVALGAKFVSNSYGHDYTAKPRSGEGRIQLSWDAKYYDHPGVVQTVSAGDSGYGVSWPASSRYVTAVGGTTLTQDSSTARGWSETVWENGGGQGTGSGCSIFEPKPFWQHDAGCSMRTVADVSADADPNTGVAIYDAGSGGWGVVGGTSVSSPLIAATYALGGTPVAGTYPASYPYADPSALNDVTTGSNGTCSPLYLCTAGPGYDGPTGLGTPDGVAAFTGPAHGDLAGQVTAASTGKPIADATVSVDGTSVTTSADGDYSLPLLAGNYTVIASAYAYNQSSASDVTVEQGATTTQNITLTAQPTVTISGKITDGSGQGWPLYAQINVGGWPNATYTDPYTGRYTLHVLPSQTYRLRITSVVPGYQTASQNVAVGAANAVRNFTVATTVDPAVGCTAAGYQTDGSTEQFTGWSGATPQDGWTVADNNGSGEDWVFGSNPTGETTQNPAPPGGSGDYAIADSNYYSNTPMDTSLTSPVVDLSGVSSPILAFDTFFWSDGDSSQSAEVDLSLDGGATWNAVWQQSMTTVEGPVNIPIPQAAGQANVQVRFTYQGNFDWWWSLDNVFIGTCSSVPGGLVAGIVTDANTGQGISAATVTNNDTSADATTTAFIPQPGFYEMFSAQTGKQQLTAADTNDYQSQAKNVTVVTGGLTKADFDLQAGDLSMSPGALSSTLLLGKSTTQNLTITNTGTVAANFDISPQSGSGAPWMSVSPAGGQLPPGGSTTIAVTLDSGGTAAAQPGSYTAQLALSTNTPYAPQVQVTMNVAPPKSWGEITGTVSVEACGGSATPISGATVEITSWASGYSLTTNPEGEYAWWLSKSNNPLTMIASMDGWQPQEQEVKIAAGKVASVNFTLQPDQSCNSKQN